MKVIEVIIFTIAFNISIFIYFVWVQNLIAVGIKYIFKYCLVVDWCYLSKYTCVQLILKLLFAHKITNDGSKKQI